MKNFLAIIALCSSAFAGSVTYTGTASPASPSVTVPSFDTSLGKLVSVEVRATTSLVRNYSVVESSGTAPGIVAFGGVQQCVVKSPLGGLLVTTQTNVPNTTVTVPPGLSFAFSDPYAFTGAQITVVNPEEYNGTGSLVFPVSYPSTYYTNYVSGAVLTRQSSTLSTVVEITYNFQ